MPLTDVKLPPANTVVGVMPSPRTCPPMLGLKPATADPSTGLIAAMCPRVAPAAVVKSPPT